MFCTVCATVHIHTHIWSNSDNLLQGRDPTQQHVGRLKSWLVYEKSWHDH